MRVFMVEPHAFDVVYEINPWMDVRKRPVRQAAMEKWGELVSTVRRYAQVDAVRFSSNNTPDECFSANHALLLGTDAVIANFSKQERKPEELNASQYFASKGFRVHRPEDAFEGEGDALNVGRNLFVGHGFRSSLASHQFVAQTARRHGLATHSLEMVDPRFYHLDTCFAPLSESSALYYPPAFSPHARALLASLVPDLLAVTESEALGFACNSLVLRGAGKVVMSQAGLSQRLEKELSARGLEAVGWDASQFLLSGGGPKCLSLIVEPAAARIAERAAELAK